MNKKTRTNKKPKTNKKSRSNKKHRSKSTKKFDMFEFINMGSTNTIIKNNDIVTNNSVEWKGNYDGKIANIHISVDDNGRKEDTKIKLDNNDLMKLLKYPSVDKQLDERLIRDFYRH